MAWGVFTFSQEGRMRLAVVLRALLITQLVVSLCMVIFCYNTSLRVMMLLIRIHKVTVYILYSLILLQAYCMKLQYTSGLRLIVWLLRSPYWPRAYVICRVWLITCNLLAVNGLLVYYACSGTLKALMKELSSSIRIGISQYLTEPTWKVLLDTMQVELNCCGADKPSDWHEIPWINMDFLNPDSKLVMSMSGADGRVLPAVSPYSCCTPRVLAACYHDPLQQVRQRQTWAESETETGLLAAASLQTRGCVEAAVTPLQHALQALQLFNLLVALLQAIITCIMVLLRSSARDAVLRGNPTGRGTAAIYGHVRHEDPSSATCTVKLDCEMGGSSTLSMSMLQRRRRRRRVDNAASCPYLS